MNLHAGRVSSQMSFAAPRTSLAGISQFVFLIFASVLDSRVGAPVFGTPQPRDKFTSPQHWL